jgi:acetyl-CoA acyltransferase
MKQVQEAYIVAATRTPIGRSHRGFFRNTRPDDLLVKVLQSALAQVPSLDPQSIEDLICGCAIPEGQQGLNIARIGAVLAGLPTSVGGITVNRFCASGLSAIQMAADRIRVGEADVMIAAGVESMSMVPMMGNAPSLSPTLFERDENIGIAYGRTPLRSSRTAVRWPPRRPAILPSRPRRSRWWTAARIWKPVKSLRSAAPCPWTKARAPTPRSKAWPSCAPCLRPAAP